MLRICVDMDEVMADTLGEHLRRYNTKFSEQIAAADLAGKGLWNAVGEERYDALREMIHAEDFFEDGIGLVELLDGGASAPACPWPRSARASRRPPTSFPAMAASRRPRPS